MRTAPMFIAMLLATVSASLAQNFPFPRSGDPRFAYAKSEKPDGGQARLDQAVLDYYESWRQTFLQRITHADAAAIKEGEEQAFVNVNVNDADAAKEIPYRSVSEGHGYGMLIAVLMAGHPRSPGLAADREQKDFDALYRFFRAHPSVPDPSSSVTHANLMAFQVQGKDLAALVKKRADKESDSASDGDLDIAYALLLAERQWGNAGRIHYGDEGRKVLGEIEQYDLNTGAATVKFGDAISAEEEMFFAVRTSDFMPQHWRAFALATQGDPAQQERRRALWTRVIEKSLAIEAAAFQKYAPATGLMPDFLRLPRGARPEASLYEPPKGYLLERVYGDGNWSYNACRTPWRLATDYLVTGETGALDQLQKLNQTMQAIATRDAALLPKKLNAGYTLDGSKELPEEEDDGKGKAKPRKREPNRDPRAPASSCFLAPLAVSAMLPGNRAWLNALWAELAPTKNKADELYFDCTVKLLCMITISGNCWDPVRAR